MGVRGLSSSTVYFSALALTWSVPSTAKLTMTLHSTGLLGKLTLTRKAIVFLQRIEDSNLSDLL